VSERERERDFTRERQYTLEPVRDAAMSRPGTKGARDHPFPIFAGSPWREREREKSLLTIKIDD